jgi:hypothetical protein
VRLFLDANVLFTAAHNPRGKAALLMEAGRSGRWEIVTSSYAREEARRNLTAKFPHIAGDYETLVSGIDLVGHPPDLPFPRNLATKDRPIFRAALASGASHLLTGDIRDFGPFMNRPEQTFGILIQTVAEFLESVAG